MNFHQKSHDYHHKIWTFPCKLKKNKVYTIFFRGVLSDAHHKRLIGFDASCVYVCGVCVWNVWDMCEYVWVCMGRW